MSDTTRGRESEERGNESKEALEKRGNESKEALERERENKRQRMREGGAVSEITIREKAR